MIPCWLRSIPCRMLNVSHLGAFHDAVLAGRKDRKILLLMTETNLKNPGKRVSHSIWW